MIRKDIRCLDVAARGSVPSKYHFMVTTTWLSHCLDKILGWRKLITGRPDGQRSALTGVSHARTDPNNRLNTEWKL
jgi:hypothetical protein